MLRKVQLCLPDIMVELLMEFQSLFHLPTLRYFIHHFVQKLNLLADCGVLQISIIKGL